jgi:hypothetical protein
MLRLRRRSGAPGVRVGLAGCSCASHCCELPAAGAGPRHKLKHSQHRSVKPYAMMLVCTGQQAVPREPHTSSNDLEDARSSAYSPRSLRHARKQAVVRQLADHDARQSRKAVNRPRATSQDTPAVTAEHNNGLASLCGMSRCSWVWQGLGTHTMKPYATRTTTMRELAQLNTPVHHATPLSKQALPIIS